MVPHRSKEGVLPLSEDNIGTPGLFCYCRCGLCGDVQLFCSKVIENHLRKHHLDKAMPWSKYKSTFLSNPNSEEKTPDAISGAAVITTNTTDTECIAKLETSKVEPEDNIEITPIVKIKKEDKIKSEINVDKIKTESSEVEAKDIHEGLTQLHVKSDVPSSNPTNKPANTEDSSNYIFNDVSKDCQDVCKTSANNESKNAEDSGKISANDSYIDSVLKDSDNIFEDSQKRKSLSMQKENSNLPTVISDNDEAFNEDLAATVCYGLKEGDLIKYQANGEMDIVDSNPVIAER